MLGGLSLEIDALLVDSAQVNASRSITAASLHRILLHSGTMHLVLLETASNQQYIFATNKLRENIGASELTYRAGTHWVIEAVCTLTGQDASSQAPAALLLDPTQNPPIEDGGRAEIVLAASGKALVLVRKEADAQALIRTVTQRALVEAPGLEITGVYVEFDWSRDGLGGVNAQVHQRYQAVRAQKPSQAQRLLRLPIVEDCATSGRPASNVYPTPDRDVEPLSVTSRCKQEQRDRGIRRITTLLQTIPALADCELAGDNSALEGEGQWIAVIHADGNGLGEIFLRFHEHLGVGMDAGRNREYVEALRRFSLALDVCTEKAFLAALPKLMREAESDFIPLVPLILGGDDLTVVCEGRRALAFVVKFLAVFEAETAVAQPTVGSIIPTIAQAALGVGRLSACAGVAIVKPHFPFSVAYELAEALMQSAKTVKTQVPTPGGQPSPCSALDFHILFDSSDVSLSRIRAKLHLAEHTQLYQRPYVTTAISELVTTEAGQAWAAFHHWEHLQDRVEALLATDPETGRRLLPNGQTHSLRAGLFLGPAAADARYRLIRDRYASLERLAASRDSLFAMPPTGTPRQVTALLDAVDAAEFVGGRQDG